MKIKTINSIITKKVNEWIETIDDEALKDDVKKNVIVTGGCIASMLLKEQVNDFDVYFTNLRTTYNVARYYHKEFFGKETPDCFVQICSLRDNQQWVDINLDDDKIPKNKDYTSLYESVLDYVPEQGEDVKYRVRVWLRSSGVAGEQPQEEEVHVDQYDSYENNEQIDLNNVLDDLEDVVPEAVEKFKPTFITDNAITLTNRIQLVLRFYGSPEVIHDNYDYVHATNYWDSKSGKVTTNVDALECILAKELKYVGSRYPLASIFRMRKFIQRGWSVNVGQILKASLQLNDMDLNNPYVFANQVTGVDVHYMAQLVRQIQSKYEEDPTIDIKSYAMNIINKIFG